MEWDGKAECLASKRGIPALLCFLFPSKQPIEGWSKVLLEDEQLSFSPIRNASSTITMQDQKEKDVSQGTQEEEDWVGKRMDEGSGGSSKGSCRAADTTANENCLPFRRLREEGFLASLTRHSRSVRGVASLRPSLWVLAWIQGL